MTKLLSALLLGLWLMIPLFGMQDFDRQLFEAALSNDSQRIQYLAKNEANIDIQDTEGWTPLIRSAQMGFEKALIALIEAGADVNIKGRHGTTALILAARWGYLEIVPALLKAEANVNDQDDNGKTALAWALENFIVFHAALKKNKASAAMWALTNDKRKAIIVLLLEAGATTLELHNVLRNTKKTKTFKKAIAELIDLTPNTEFQRLLENYIAAHMFSIRYRCSIQ
jgi:hypothetical protein